ncbi:MAG: dTDP-4-dehydrorhamnose 3,5-epimerase [Pseudomonadota bacterium]
MNIEKTEMPDVLVLTPRRFGDDRGWFSEAWNKTTLLDAGIDLNFVQDNHSFSAEIGTLRGLHFQAPPRAQDKLVRVARGKIWDVAVDIRKGSPTFGQWVGRELSAENRAQLLVPKGFLHGFITLEPGTEVLYKCTDTYAPGCDGAVRFDDPDLAVDWQLGDRLPVLSNKDMAAPLMRDFATPFIFED